MYIYTQKWILYKETSWINCSCSGGFIARYEIMNVSQTRLFLSHHGRTGKNMFALEVWGYGIERWEQSPWFLEPAGDGAEQYTVHLYIFPFSHDVGLYPGTFGRKNTWGVRAQVFCCCCFYYFVWSNTHALYCPHIALKRWGLDCPCFNRKTCVPRRGKRKERAMMAALPLGPASVCVRLPNPENLLDMTHLWSLSLSGRFFTHSQTLGPLPNWILFWKSSASFPRAMDRLK